MNGAEKVAKFIGTIVGLVALTAIAAVVAAGFGVVAGVFKLAYDFVING